MLKWFGLFAVEVLTKWTIELLKIFGVAIALMWLCSHVVLGPLWLLSDPTVPWWVTFIIYGIPYMVLGYLFLPGWFKKEWKEFTERHR